ncbi:DedA family protein [Mameliella sediminis]|uniref:DedA family protein n=1 Tax=Mameliella sediminis TaxID=2836866 RepID=UPI001C471BF1|nr:DedA family protein [Mameliella sediminis]MBV7394839.1 DedA family protein [Mameliella sediminis]MBY6159966.1 DedA family protein [Mameliella alba]MBY6168437.1 DedA family protein [Mameliella alba]MBY6173457.1 DedA family protein [Mameliella alba]
MSDAIFALVAGYGLWVVAGSAFLSCLLVPVPTALVMLAAGAFAAAGDLSLGQVFLAGWLAALAGDNAGYQLGRWGGRPLVRQIARRTGKRRLIARGRLAVHRYGALGVFFSTWLVAPLGPWVNLISGAMGLSRWRFAVWDTLGETIWVGAYVGLGYGFGTQIDAVSQVVSDWAGLLAALAVAAGFSVALAMKLRRKVRVRG